MKNFTDIVAAAVMPEEYKVCLSGLSFSSSHHSSVLYYTVMVYEQYMDFYNSNVNE